MALGDTGRYDVVTVDTDVHSEVLMIDHLFPYLPEHWVEQISNTVFRGPTDTVYPPKLAPSPTEGSANQQSVVSARLTDSGATLAILNCLYAVDSLHNPDQAVALTQAINDWQIAEWLERDSRIRASIVVPVQVPELAAEEVHRVADRPGFVQVLLPARAHHPYGNRLYHPLWEAITSNDLVAGIHHGGAPGNPPTATGWPSYYLEEYVGMAPVFAAQVTSLVAEGVFDLFPTLRVTLLESGVTWLPSHMWRFDKEWKNLRRQVPWVRKPPSEYIRQHVRLTVQPLDTPPELGHLAEVIEQLECDDLLMFSSAYPHLHAEASERWVSILPESLRRKIYAENACSWYRLSPDQELPTQSRSVAL